jgi:hypothetical protein
MKKIMFSDTFCLTKAVLDGTKTMTRRVLKEGTPLGNWEETVKHLPYKVGDIVAIAQPYKDIIESMAEYSDIIINVDGSINREYKAGYTNKMFVKADLMPHHIRITDVKIEHLQDISDKECLREGVKRASIGFYAEGIRVKDWEKEAHRETASGCLKLFPFPRPAFASLIDKISGKGTWESNPWVVAYSFELVD